MLETVADTYVFDGENNATALTRSVVDAFGGNPAFAEGNGSESQDEQARVLANTATMLRNQFLSFIDAGDYAYGETVTPARLQMDLGGAIAGLVGSHGDVVTEQVRPAGW